MATFWRYERYHMLLVSIWGVQTHFNRSYTHDVVMTSHSICFLTSLIVVVFLNDVYRMHYQYVKHVFLHDVFLSFGQKWLVTPETRVPSSGRPNTSISSILDRFGVATHAYNQWFFFGYSLLDWYSININHRWRKWSCRFRAARAPRAFHVLTDTARAKG